MRASVVHRLAVAGCAALVLAGCGADPQDAPDSRVATEQALRSVADVAASTGLPLPAATGRFTVCSVSPFRVKYGAGGAVDVPRGELGGAIAALTAAPVDQGWEVESTTTTPRSGASLTRDGSRASLGESRRTPCSMSVGVSASCVRATEDQDSLVGASEPVDLGPR